PRPRPGPADAGRLAHARDPDAGRRIPADAALRQPRGPGWRVEIPPPPVGGASQAHPAPHAGPAGGRDAGVAHPAPRARGARLLPGSPAARGGARAAAGARTLPLERGAASPDRTRRRAPAGAPGCMPRRAFAVALLLAAACATPVEANPPPVPLAVRRALRESTVLVLPSECGGGAPSAPPGARGTARRRPPAGVRGRAREPPAGRHGAALRRSGCRAAGAHQRRRD